MVSTMTIFQGKFTLEVEWSFDGKKAVLVHSGSPMLGVTVTQYGAHDTPILTLPPSTRSFDNMEEANHIQRNLNFAIVVEKNWSKFWLAVSERLAKPEALSTAEAQGCAMNASNHLRFWMECSRHDLIHFQYSPDGIYIDGSFKDKGKVFTFRVGFSPEELIFNGDRKTADGVINVATLPHDREKLCPITTALLIGLTHAIAHNFEGFAQDVQGFVAKTLKRQYLPKTVTEQEQA